MSPGWSAAAAIRSAPLITAAISSSGAESCPTSCPVAWLQGSALGATGSYLVVLKCRSEKDYIPWIIYGTGRISTEWNNRSSAEETWASEGGCVWHVVEGLDLSLCRRCNTPNTFGTVNMGHTVNLRLSWSEQ